MNLNIFLALAIGGLTLGGAGLAGHLASTKKWHKWCFWGTGLVAVVLIGIQTTINEHAQTHLQAQLDKIQKNTETPPTVTLNPTFNPDIHVMPLPQEKHTHLTFPNPLQIPIQPEPPTFPLVEGKRVNINIGVYNSGEFLATNCKMAAVLWLQREPINEAKAFTGFLESAKFGGCPDLMPRSGTNYVFSFHTFQTPVLSRQDIDQLVQGKADICGASRTFWRDETGSYQTDFFECLDANLNPGEANPAPTFAWHALGSHNGETKLSK